MVVMNHHVENARALPTSVAGEFETLLPAQTQRSQGGKSHGERATLILSDNPRWIAGTERAVIKHQVAIAMRDKYPDGVYLYHRRVLNKTSETTIDILAITSTGVWVVEVDEAAGNNVQFEGRSWRRGSSYERFLVDGEDYTAVVDDVDTLASRVVAALESAGWSGSGVQAILCLVGGSISAPAVVGNTYVATLPQLVKLMKHGPVRLSGFDITGLALALGERFPRPRRTL